MKFVLFYFLATASVAFALRTSPCNKGKEAFETELYPRLSKHCIACHRNGKGPPFAVEDIDQSYRKVLTYQQFENIKDSFFVKHGGNLHCKDHGIDCATTEADLKPLVEQWWSKGQQSCPQNAPLTTTPIKLEFEPGKKTKILKWKLKSMHVGFGTAQFQLTARKKEVDGISQVWLTQPRLLATEHALSIEGIEVWAGDRKESTFATVKTEIGSVLPGEAKTYPLLSTEKIVVKNKALISVSFLKLEQTHEPVCHQLAAFKEKIQPLIRLYSCHSCHGGGPEKSEGNLEARSAADFSGDAAALCAQIKQRMGKFVTESTFLQYAAKGANYHEVCFPEYKYKDILKDFQEWLIVERKSY